MDERAANNLPPTLEQMQSRQAVVTGKSRLQSFGNGARSVMRWVQIVRFSVALVVGICCSIAGIYFLVDDRSNGSQNNFWYLLLFGIVVTAASAYVLRRLFRARTAAAPPPSL